MKDKLLWLDDARYPPTKQWNWVKTAAEAIEALKAKDVLFASLDHDLGPEHYPWSPNYDWIATRRTAGWEVTRWLEEQYYRHDDDSCVPPEGIRVHSMNTVGAAKMIGQISAIYNTDFQCIKKFEVLPWNLSGQPNGWCAANTTMSMVERYKGVRHSA